MKSPLYLIGYHQNRPAYINALILNVSKSPPSPDVNFIILYASQIYVFTAGFMLRGVLWSYDGRGVNDEPVPRMPDTFCLDPKYENFNAYSDVVKFETVHGGSSYYLWFFVTMFVVSILIPIAPLLRTHADNTVTLNLDRIQLNTLIFGTIGIIVSLLFLVDYIQSQIKWRKLVRHGVALDGEVIEAKRIDKFASYRLEVTYRFISPTFELLNGTQRSAADNRASSDRKPPMQGTPVKILYVNPRCYVLL